MELGFRKSLSEATFYIKGDEIYCYLDRLNLWALATQYELAKGRSDDGGLTTPPMIKSVKDGEEEEEESSHS